MSEFVNVNNPKLYIDTVAAEIQSNLEPVPGHKQRNAYAHIYGMIKVLCSDTYSKADPVKVYAVITAIKLNPNGSREEILKSARQIRRDYLDAQ